MTLTLAFLIVVLLVGVGATAALVRRPRAATTTPPVLAALLVAALVAGACGSDSEQSGGLFDPPKDEITASVGDADTGDEATSKVETSDAESDLAESDNTGDADDAADPVGESEADEAMDEEAAGAILNNSRSNQNITPSVSIGSADAAEGTAYYEPTEALVDGIVAGDSEGLFADEILMPEPTQPSVDRLRDNRFQFYGYRQFILAEEDNLSTFALDVDTGSFTVGRRWLAEGVLPPPESVRVEEYVNAFDYDYETPRRGLEVTVDGGPSPFDRDNYLIRVGVQAEKIADADRPPVALTFVVDTSGSMDRDDRLELVKDSLEILVDELDDDDTVAIVIYSDSAGTLLRPTRVSDSREIYDAIDSLSPGGSTNLESGLIEGYALAREAYREDGVNRVIIASDGLANAGVTDVSRLASIIREDADNGIHLVTVGYGMGNFNDVTMEQLADNGDGFYAYVDTIEEAERLFEHELTSTLITAAIDAKIQVVFDPEVVESYRLIGFENRGVLDSQFRNDSVDAGELGAGHQVTAMYEVELQRGVSIDDRGDIGEVFLRWQDPESGEVIEIDEDIDLRDVVADFTETEPTFQLATVVTSFAELLRDNPYADDVNINNVLVEARRVAEMMDSDTTDALVEMIERATQLA